MSEFVYGFHTVVFNFLLAAVLTLYAYIMIPVVKRSFKENLKNKYTTLCCGILIGLLAIFSISTTPDGIYIIPYPINYYAVFFAGVWMVVVGVSTKLGKTTDESYDKKLLDGIEETKNNGGTVDIHNFNYSKELRRKMVHMASLCYLAAILVVTPIFSIVFKFVYEINPVRCGWEEFFNTYLLGSGDDIVTSAFATIMLGFLGSFFVQVDAELTRLRSPETPFLLKKTLQKTRRATETKTFGAHISIVVAFMISAMILFWTPEFRYEGINALCAVVATSALADMMAALVGRKWGKTKTKINNDKSYMGCIAGGLTAFLVSVPFVGAPLAVITVIAFLFNDLILAKINLSDNLTNPLVLGIIYRLLIFLVTPMLPVNWFLIQI